MDVIGQIKKLEAFHFVVTILGFVGSISPGLLILFIFKRDLFISLDVLKLILLSASLSLPAILLNYLLVSSVPDSKEAEPDMAGTLAVALLASAIIFFLPLIITYLFGLALHTYIWLLVIFEIFLAIVIVLLSIKEKSK